MTTSAELTPELKRRCWEVGLLQFKLKEYQLPVYAHFHDNLSRRTVLNCSRRFGKSFIMACIAIEYAIRNPGWSIRFICDTQKHQIGILLPLVREITSDAPSSVRPKRIANTGEYRFPNGSSLFLYGADGGGADSIRGEATNMFLIDEAGHVQDLEYLIESVVSPALLSSAAFGQGGWAILASTPGISLGHPFRNYYLAAEAEGRAIHRTIYDTDYPKEIIEEFAREAGGKNSTTWKREYEALFVSEENRVVVPEFDEAQHVRDYPRPPEFEYLYRHVSTDLGTRDLTVSLFGYYDFKNACLVIEEERQFTAPKMVTGDLAALIRETETELWQGLPVRLRQADSLDDALTDTLSITHNLPTSRPSKPAGSRDAGINKIREWLRAGRLVIHPNCKLLIRTLKEGIWNKDRRDFERAPGIGHLDAIAALSYLIRSIDEQTNPIPHTFGKTASQVFNDHLIRVSRGEDPGANLKRLGGNAALDRFKVR